MDFAFFLRSNRKYKELRDKVKCHDPHTKKAQLFREVHTPIGWCI